MDTIQKQYQDYAFLDSSGTQSPEFPLGIVFDNRSATEANVMTNMLQIIERSYELPFQWYFVVFCPIDRAYTKDSDWFSVKGISKCRDYFKKPEAIILTREVNATKVHINCLVCTQHPVVYRKSNIYCNKYYVNIQNISDGLHGRKTVLNYIMKESHVRSFTKYLDYITYSRI